MSKTRRYFDSLYEMEDTLPTHQASVAPATSVQSALRDRVAWWAFALTAAALLPLMVLASLDFGVTWDEKSRHFYGELVWGYLRGVRDISYFPETGGHLYGGLFDTLCAIVEQWLPQYRYVVRHEINAIFGWIGVVYCGRLAARLFGTWTGVLAMILLVSSPRYFAHSMNNPKDLPFAALSVAALYYFSTVSPTWPYISRATAIKIVLALALALNVRAGALLYLGYLGLLVTAFVMAERNLDWRRLTDTVGRLTAITAVVLVLGTAFWPWAQGSPLTRPISAFWGIHLTGASARRAGNSPWSVRRRAFQAGWVPTGSRRRRWFHFGCGVNDEVSVAHRVVRDGELEHPVEHHPAAAGAAAVEAEHELIQVAGQVRGVDRALVRAQQPPLDQ